MSNEVNLNNISFPVYKLLEQPPIIERGVAFYLNKRIDQEVFKKRIIDDKNLPGKTLSRRRLAIPESDLYKIKHAIYFLGDLVKLAKSTTWFIDSNGMLFQYKKTQFVPLVCRRIVNVFPGPSTGKILEVEGISTRFKTLFSPPVSHSYCLLLKISNSYVLYGTCEKKHKDTRRKI